MGEKKSYTAWKPLVKVTGPLTWQNSEIQQEYRIFSLFKTLPPHNRRLNIVTVDYSWKSCKAQNFSEEEYLVKLSQEEIKPWTWDKSKPLAPASTAFIKYNKFSMHSVTLNEKVYKEPKFTITKINKS